MFIFLFGATGSIGILALSITSTPFASAILIASLVNTFGISFAIFAAFEFFVSLTDIFIIWVSETVETDIFSDNSSYVSSKFKFFITFSKTVLDFITFPYVTANFWLTLTWSPDTVCDPSAFSVFTINVVSAWYTGFAIKKLYTELAATHITHKTAIIYHFS